LSVADEEHMSHGGDGTAPRRAVAPGR
jgi:hypothetical protein